MVLVPEIGLTPQTVERFKALGVKCERGVPEVIVGRVGQSTRLVLGECEKLATYVGPGGTEYDAAELVAAGARTASTTYRSPSGDTFLTFIPAPRCGCGR